MLTLSFPEEMIFSTEGWESARTLDQLPDFLRYVARERGEGQELSQSTKKMGSPHTLVVAAAGLRAADCVRALRVFQTNDVVVAKLFAKHIKMTEAVEFLHKHRYAQFFALPISGPIC